MTKKKKKKKKRRTTFAKPASHFPGSHRVPPRLGLCLRAIAFVTGIKRQPQSGATWPEVEDLGWSHSTIVCASHKLQNFPEKDTPELRKALIKARGWWPRSRSFSKIFFWGFVFLWVNLALLNPIESFREEARWFKQRKTRRKVAPFLTPLGAARAARSADWLKIDMWENPSFDSSGSRQLVGTLRCALSLRPLTCRLTCTSTHVRVSLVVSTLHAYRWACNWKWSSRQR